MGQVEKNQILSIFEKKRYSEEDKNFLKKAIEHLEDKNLEKAFQIAKYLSTKGFEKEVVISSILTFQEEDLSKLKKEFGDPLKNILEDSYALEKIILKSQKEKKELPREIILSTISSIEAIVIKIVSKLVELKIEKKMDCAKEIMGGYVPMANRLGLENLKKDLAEESFKIINPKKYSEISNFLKMSKRQREIYIKKITSEMGNLIKNKIKNAEVKGREKQVYSMYEKMTKRKIPLNKQKDQFGVRIILKEEGDCYHVFEILTNVYPLIDGTFKDYIKSPKENGYQSIHLCIKDGERMVEVQIRTKEMNEVAEEGAAAHWTYKKIKGDQRFEKKTAWLKEFLKLKETKKPFFGEIKLKLFGDKIYCYTPKGKSISLPPGSTILDFAYQVHAEVGNHAIGAKINDKFAPFKTNLKGGDTVEIITNKFQRPRRDWLKFVKTKYAKKMISKEVKKFENIPVPKSSTTSKEAEEEYESLVELKDFPNHILNFAKCCNPLPGDQIVGILKSYRRAIIHKKNCNRIENAKNHEVFSEWKNILNNPTKIHAQTSDRSGILADIINTLSRKNFKVKEANAKLIGNDFAECYFVVFANTINDLNEIIERMKKIKGVKKFG